MRNGAGDTERKVLVGTEPVFAVRLSQPPNSAAIKVVFDPDAVVLDAAVDMTLTRVRPSDTVDSIDAHRMKLTSTDAIPTVNLKGIPSVDFGAAFVVATDSTFCPVQVLNIRENTILLAGPLPHDVEISSEEPADVVYATHLGTLPAAVSAAATGGVPIPWVCDYVADLGDAITAHVAQQERGVLHVRRQIFDTGLDHHAFVSMMRGVLALDAVFGEQADWMPQIEAAHLALVLWVRGNIDSLGADREDSVDGGAFRLAHAYFTAALIERDAAARAALKAEAIEHANAAKESLIETSPDTAIPEVRDHGKRASLLAGSSTRTATETRRFYVGRPR